MSPVNRSMRRNTKVNTDWTLKGRTYPDNKVQGANMGPMWGRQDPGGPHVGPMNLAIRVLGRRVWAMGVYYEHLHPVNCHPQRTVNVTNDYHFPNWKKLPVEYFNMIEYFYVENVL